MIGLPKMLVPVAKHAGIKVPDNINNFNRAEYPHWVVYTTLQLGAPLPYSTAHGDNAKVIAGIPDSRIRQITLKEVEELGFAIGTPIP